MLYCNTAWLMYVLESKERWWLDGSLNYYTVLHLELFCQRSGKEDEILYVQTSVQLHDRDGVQPGSMLIVQRKSQPLLMDDFRTPEDKTNEGMLTSSAMNPFNPNHAQPLCHQPWQHSFGCKEKTLELRLFLWYLSVLRCWEDGWREGIMNKRNSQVMTWEWVCSPHQRPDRAHSSHGVHLMWV